MLKFLKKIKPIYIILGLFVVVIIVSALGSRTKEGMMNPTDAMTIQTFETQANSIANDIDTFILAQGTSWGSGVTFNQNVNDYIMKKVYFDNSGNTVYATVATAFTPSDHYPITQSDVDAAKALIDQQIALLTSTADQNTLNTNISNLISIMDKSIPLIYTNKTDTNKFLYNYDADDLVRDKPVKNYDNEDFEQGYMKGYDSGSRHHEDHDSEDYWKQAYLKSLNAKPITTTSLVNPSNGSLLNQNSSPWDAGDASSGTGTGTGTAGTSAAGTGTGAAGTSAAGTDTASYNISQGPVQQGPVQQGPATTSDAYLLNNSQTAASNCPVGGCVTAGSSPNNCKPAPVPPCPPCERCPEPKFDCKRVPRYNSATNSEYMPQPVLNDFSQFGM